MPEYKLRRAINQGPGYRNFNVFLNRYRIAEVKAALANPACSPVPVLTLAMDAGFQSLGLFNRAFKAETGVTPTEFRPRPPEFRCDTALIPRIGQPFSTPARQRWRRFAS